MEIVGIIASFLFVIVVGSIVRGWVFVSLWSWFVVPIFHLPGLSIPYGIGIGMIFSYLTVSLSDADKLKDRWKGKSMSEIIGDVLVRMAFYPLSILLIGWIVKQFA